MTAFETWKQRVVAQYEQSQRAKLASGIEGDDFWEPLSSLFKADPRRTDDFEVQRLLQEVQPSMTLLDVGGGAGRFALPLALHCKHVTVVEPSPGMGESLRQLATEAGIGNVTIVARRWEEADVEPADVVLSAHVVYMIEDIRPFVVKLAEHARDKVLMPTYMHPPMARYAPFWRRVHGEDKQELPGAMEFMQVLWEMDIYPDLAMFEGIPVRALRSWDRALETLRHRLFVQAGTAKDEILQHAMHELLIETPDGYVVKGTQPGRLALIVWRPE